jgi:TolB-like protein
MTELSSSPGQIRSLAVLPSENLSHDSEQEYFAEGLTEALINSLAKIGALRVISRTTAMRYHKPPNRLSCFGKRRLRREGRPPSHRSSIATG